MPKVILMNEIMTDGIGDFSHFLDIYLFLREHHATCQFELIPVICFDRDPVKPNAERQFNKILSIIKSNNIPLYFYGDKEAYDKDISKNTALIQCFTEAVQIINISYPAVGFFTKLLSYVHPKARLKSIGEHEFDFSPQGWMSRSLGLGSNSYGIKCKQIERLEPADAFSVIAHYNPLFTNMLLKVTGSDSFFSFQENNILTSAYFQPERTTDLKLFLLLFSVNQSLPKNKDIAVYLSSNGANNFVDEINNATEFKEILSNSDLKRIEWIFSDDSQSSIEINLTGNRVIRVFLGFHLCDTSYSALYQCLEIALVTGDNTLEQAISSCVLPVYRSFNYSYKSRTLWALVNIIKETLGSAPAKLLQDMQLFFEYAPVSEMGGYQRCSKTYAQFAEEYKDMDLISMIKVWPVVAKHIQDKYNFFDKLEEIFFEDLDPELLAIAYDQESKGIKQDLRPQVVFSQQERCSFFSRDKNKFFIGGAVAATAAAASCIYWASCAL
ncbi:hypothetical protein [Legionella worsleiensis]|uniref:Uncharacterized protein n=1 Tax=Legionella worsleiensis TaxID=45076 RepID=A0A0W1AJ90_9GAMM|nr:hypothetical protein [Legionella worsleiensis]KTD81332.1 hypothetical protein Lwor_0833 [Legionella worsleiensis]STY30745.1 Uncharacterised protein [Legionella worsleiensis]